MEKLIPRFFKKPKQSFFLLGPRGTGKSTWLKEKYPHAIRIDLLDAPTYRDFLAHPERLTEIVSGNPEKKTVIIDEVQKIPELLDVVHKAMEEQKDAQFILTGSSARKLRRSGTNLLAGRALMCFLHPFLATELGLKFSLDEALRFGMIPLVYGSKDSEKTLQSYVSLYIHEEVQMESLTRNMGNFSRFLESLSFSQGGVLNVSNIARECGVERKTVEGYVGILEDLLVSFRIPVFTKRAKREIVSHPKFYFFDCGVFRVIRPKGPLDRAEEIDGMALEGLMAQQLRAWNAYGGEENNLYYWRTRSGVEVDFVVYGKRNFWAVEVKNATRVQESDLRGLRAFKNDYPECEAFLVYRGKERLNKKGIVCIPCEEFLRRLK